MKQFPKKTLVSISFWLVLVFLFGSGLAYGSEDIKTVDVMGTGKIIGGNDPEARAQAISDGLVAAVSYVVMDLLSPDAVVLNFETLNAMFYTHTDAFIQNYKVMTEMKFSNHYRVMVRVTISIPAVQQKISELGIMFDRTNKSIPKILIVLAEQRIQDISPQFFWGNEIDTIVKPAEQAMAEALEKKGFFIINYNETLKRKNMALPVLSIAMDENAVFKLGEQFQADMVLVGEADAKQTQNKLGTELKSFKGQVTVKAYKMSTRSEIGSVSQVSVNANTDEFAGGNQALADAGRLAGNMLAPKLKAEWLKNDSREKSQIEIIINGTRNLANFVKFRRNLKAIEGVRNVLTKEMKYNVTIITVDYQGTAKALADYLLLRTIEGFGIDISEVSENRISLNLTAE